MRKKRRRKDPKRRSYEKPPHMLSKKKQPGEERKVHMVRKKANEAAKRKTKLVATLMIHVSTTWVECLGASWSNQQLIFGAQTELTAKLESWSEFLHELYV